MKKQQKKRMTIEEAYTFWTEKKGWEKTEGEFRFEQKITPHVVRKIIEIMQTEPDRIEVYSGCARLFWDKYQMQISSPYADTLFVEIDNVISCYLNEIDKKIINSDCKLEAITEWLMK